MKVRTFFSALAIAAVALLVIGVGGFVGLTARSPLSLLAQGGQSLPAAAPFVPRNAPVMVSLLTRPDRLADLWLLLANPGNRRQAQAEVSRLEKSLLAGSGLTYEADIKPWLGSEITFAVTDADLDQDPANGSQPGYLVALSCRDSERAKAVLELFWQKRAIAGDNLVFEQFAGSKLIYSQPRPTDQPAGSVDSLRQVASALIDPKFVLLANDPRVIQRALTTVQSRDLNLEQDLGYRKAVAALSEKRFGLVVLNLPPSLQWLGLTSGDPFKRVATGLGNEDGVIDRAIFSLRLHRQGLLADAALLAAAGHRFQPQRISRSADVEVGQFLPADTPLAAVGSHLDQLWHDLRQSLPYYATAIPALQPFWQRLQAPVANQPTESLLGWIQEDYALGLVGQSSRQVPGWVLVAERQADSQAATEQLDALARQQGLSVGPLQLADRATQAWTRLAVQVQPHRGGNAASDLSVTTEVDGLHAQLGNYELLSNSAAALYQAFQTEGRSLLTTAAWQQTTEPLAQPNSGYLYLDWQALKPTLLKNVPWLRLAEALGQPLFSHLQSIAVTSYGRDEQIHSGGVFLRLRSS